MRLNTYSTKALANLGDEIEKGQDILKRIDGLFSTLESTLINQRASYQVVVTGKLPVDVLTGEPSKDVLRGKANDDQEGGDHG
ncbi:MAG: hypothetical protein ROR55_03065 [Devosia sp.]